MTISIHDAVSILVQEPFYFSAVDVAGLSQRQMITMIDKYALRKLGQNTDRIETVVFQSKTGQGTFAAFTLNRVNISFVDKATTDGPGRLIRKQSVIFRIYALDLNAANAPVPKENDRFQRSDGTIYVCTDGVPVEMIAEVFDVKCQLLPV